jgi:hypothetical protein
MEVAAHAFVLIAREPRNDEPNPNGGIQQDFGKKHTESVLKLFFTFVKSLDDEYRRRTGCWEEFGGIDNELLKLGGSGSIWKSWICHHRLLNVFSNTGGVCGEVCGELVCKSGEQLAHAVAIDDTSSKEEASIWISIFCLQSFGNRLHESGLSDPRATLD